MNNTVFIIHGVGGYPEENWFPWLKVELEKLGCNVIVPQFPTPEGQTLENWLTVFEQYKDQVNTETIFVGHSLGAPFVLNVLEKYPARAAFLVAGFTGTTGTDFDPGMATFAQRDFDWDEITIHCTHFYIFQSDNDPYIKIEKGKELASTLDTKMILVPNAGHFNEGAGYMRFDLLLENIKKELTIH